MQARKIDPSTARASRTAQGTAHAYDARLTSELSAASQKARVRPRSLGHRRRRFPRQSPANRAKIAFMGAKTGAAAAIRRMALKRPDLSHSQIAKRVGCAQSNVGVVLKRFLGEREESELTGFRDDKPAVLEALSLNILESITPDKLAKASALQLATSYGILHDKIQVMRGQATGINVTVLMDVIEAIKLQDQRMPNQQLESARDSQTIAEPRESAQNSENKLKNGGGNG